MKHIVYLALGTNLGDRKNNLGSAIAALQPEVSLRARSPIYETKPWGGVEQPDYLNMVLEGETAMEPLALIARLKDLEGQLGRLPAVRYGPRLIDIDILFYDDLVLETPQLTIPHPRLHERAFVLAPLADLAPDLVHPLLHKSIRQLLEAVDSTGVKRYG